jgi:ABC-type multidrug transport system ATPase subunit
MRKQTKLVNTMLENLNLTGCADVMIGGPLIKGIRGGQRKRTSVGVELVTNPKLVFLDEPTSGLDSNSALSCVKLLKSIAKRGTTVLCTIHQPSSEVFELFHNVILMKDGRIMWQGPVDGVVAGFSNLGYPPPVINS